MGFETYCLVSKYVALMVDKIEHAPGPKGNPAARGFVGKAVHTNNWKIGGKKSCSGRFVGSLLHKGSKRFDAFIAEHLYLIAFDASFLLRAM